MSEKKQVLVICCSTAGRMYLGVLLKRIWFTPVLVKTAMEGVLAAQNNPLSVILFDAELPDDELRSSLSLLRKDQSLRAIPLIAVAGGSGSPDSEGFIVQGCSAVIKRPIDLSLLYGIMNRLSGQPRATPRAPVKMRVDVLHGAPERFFICINISEGGLYLRAAAPLPEGTVLHLRFALPLDKDPVEVTAAVVRTAPLGREGDAEPGMGLSFTSISDQNRQKLRNFVQWEMMSDLEWDAGI